MKTKTGFITPVVLLFITVAALAAVNYFVFYKGPSISDSIRITSPNGGEVLKIGDTTQVAWEVKNIPPGAQLDLELFEITSNKVELNKEGGCLNCMGSGLRSGVPAIYPLVNGSGSAEWIVGKLYSGWYVKSGSHYIMKATLTKVGNADAGECPTGSFKGTCDVIHKIDWSDRAFSLVGQDSQTKTYTNSQYEFSLEYPNGSTIEERVTPAYSDIVNYYPEYTTIFFSGTYGKISITPTYVLGYGGMGCKDTGSQNPPVLAGKSVRWVEHTCGNAVEFVINFKNPPAPWKTGELIGKEGNVIIVSTTPSQLENVKDIVSTFRFTQ